jgi:hypothetical protein
LSIDFSKQSVRDLLVVTISSLAIIATQSRSGIIFGTLILMVYLAAPRGTGTFSGTARIGLGLGASLALGLAAVVGFQLAGLSSEQAWRIQSLLSLDVTDTSTTDRLEVASYAVEKFFEYFWTGRGLGGSRYYGIFSHNSFLEIGLDYGIGAVLIYVGLILYVVFKAFRFGLAQNLGMVIIAFQIAYYSMFSHSVHSSSVFSIFFAAVAVNATIRSPEERDDQIPRR